MIWRSSAFLRRYRAVNRPSQSSEAAQQTAIFSTRDHAERSGYLLARSHKKKMQKNVLLNIFDCFELNQLPAEICDNR